MFKKLVYKVAAHRHPWRYMEFDELAELYTSMTLRSLGFSLIGIFVPVYLYQKGVDLETIVLLFSAFFIMRAPLSFPIAKFIGRVGPKHGIAASTILLVLSLSILLGYEALGIPLIVLMFVFTLSNALFFISTNIDFSKIKHKNHGGKELGWLYIFERVGAAAGPIFGGVVATVVSPEATIIFAIAVLALSTLPLFLTKEPVRTHYEISFKGFKHRPLLREYVSLSAFNIVNVANGFIWPLFLAAFIFLDETYAKVGGVVGLSTILSLFLATIFGRFIDNRKGYALLQFGTFMNVVLQVSRSLVFSGFSAVSVAALGEPVNLAVKMPIAKTFFDAADKDDNYRTVFIVWMEAVVAVVKAALLFLLYLSLVMFENEVSMRVFFVIVGIAGLGMLVQRFPALKKV